jgi:hypothetical protein
VHAPYRIAAPPKPPRFEAIDVYEAVLRARAGRSRVSILVLSSVLLALWVGVTSSARRSHADPREHESALRARQRVERARKAIAATKATVRTEQRRFELAVLSAIDNGVAPSTESVPCRTALPEQASALVAGARAFPLLIVKRGDRDLPSPSFAPMLARAQRAEEELDAAHVGEGIASADAMTSSPSPPYDVVLVASALKHPLRTTESSFDPGEIAGRAYLYDHARHRVTCAGDIRAVSSSSVAYSFVPGSDAPAALDQGPSLSISLERDLDAQVERAIARGLTALD